LKKALIALAAVAAIALLAGAASQIEGLRPLAGIVFPYVALALLFGGLIRRIVRWSLAPVPFRIPTVCGQQKSLPWIKASRIESPSSTSGVLARMGLEILLFRSLFRNTRSQLREGPRLTQAEAKWLWLGAMAFHWSMLVVLLRHLRFVVEPAPKLALLLESLDGFFQIGAPTLYATDIVMVAALLYLLSRRLREPQVRFISLFTDYFALFLLLGIAISGVWMRYFARIDAVSVKQLALSLTIFAPAIPKNVGGWFFVHLALVSTLVAYLPFSKLMHMGGIFLSATRNLANDNRMRRHVNPWNAPVKLHTYDEWEEEFHDKIEAAGLPMEKR
jgi:nitrate reductase gamma subunit